MLLLESLSSLTEKKRSATTGQQYPMMALPFCLKVKILYFPYAETHSRPTWEIIRAAPGKAATDDFSAHFQPLSAHFFERADW